MRHLGKVLVTIFLVAGFSSAAFATSVGVGALTFDQGTLNLTSTTFDITNLTGTSAFPPDFPITTPLTFTITNLVANIQGGGSLTVSGANFTVVDAQGDVNCTVPGDAAAGGCDFAAYDVLSATLNGTLSPTSGLVGLPPGATGILASFSATITPSADCGGGPSSISSVGVAAATLTPGCDGTTIFATTTSSTTAVPEPETMTLLEIGMVGLLARYRLIAAGKVTKWFRALRG